MGRQAIPLVLLLAIALVSSWQFYEAQQREQQLQARVTELETNLQAMEERLKSLEGQVVKLRESSVEGLVNEANSAILEGWESLVNTVESELKKARKSLREEYFPPSQSIPKQPQGDLNGQRQQAQPRLESHDGTDRT